MKNLLALAAFGVVTALAQSSTSTAPRGEPSSSESDCAAYCQRDAAATADCSVGDIEGCYCTEAFAEAQENCYSSDACTTSMAALISSRSSTCASYTASGGVISATAANFTASYTTPGGTGSSIDSSAVAQSTNASAQTVSSTGSSSSAISTGAAGTYKATFGLAAIAAAAGGIAIV